MNALLLNPTQNFQTNKDQLAENIREGLSWFGVSYPIYSEFDERVIQVAQDPDMQQIRRYLTEMVYECRQLKNRIGTLEEHDRFLFYEAKKMFAEFVRLFLIYPNAQDADQSIDADQFIENVKAGLSWFGVNYSPNLEFNERMIQAAQDPGARQICHHFAKYVKIYRERESAERETLLLFRTEEEALERSRFEKNLKTMIKLDIVLFAEIFLGISLPLAME